MIVYNTPSQTPPAPPTLVVLVHGLLMRGAVMRLLALRLARAGYRTALPTLPFTRGAFADTSARLASFVAALESPSIALVGHSLGGLACLAAAHDPRIAGRVSRVLLLGSPYRDCAVARKLMPHGATRWLVGRSLCDWLEGGARPIAPAHCITGVIAGTSPIGMGRLFVPQLESPHDGTVTVAETRLPGARHLMLPVTHSAMVVAASVSEAVTHFVAHGEFPAAKRAARAVESPHS